MLKELKINSKDKLERAEGITILSILVSGIVLSLGMLLSILNTKGIPAILAMIGGFSTFISTLALIFIWMIKDFKSG